MDISNTINALKVSGSYGSSVKKTSEKNKWQLTDSLKEKIVELAKKDAKNSVYMGNEFMSLRKAEVAKVAPDRAALIGKFDQSMGSGNMEDMKKYKKQIKGGFVFCSGYHMRQNIKGRGQVLRFIYIMRVGKKFLHILKELGGMRKKQKQKREYIQR